MKKKLLATILASVLAISMLTGCGKDPELTKFKNDLDEFCSDLADLDKKMNAIDGSNPTDKDDLFEYLSEVNMKFNYFAEMDFPEEFDYLESIADEAGSYMTEAVTYYNEAFENNSYNEYTAEYAEENYKRAMKRLQIIITFLHGEEPTGDDIKIEYEE